MCEHSELVAEMPILEKMSTQDRLKLARKRRMQQLKKFNQREKDFNYKKKNSDNLKRSKGRKNDYKVHFVPSVMLLEAAARNDVEEVRRLLMLGVSPDSTNEDGLTALHQCCIDDSEEMMKLLIEFGANINAKDSEQWTPLHAAATCGLLHLVKYLITKGADLLAVNADGNMPYDICEDEATLDYIESEMAKKGITQEMIDETRASVENKMLADLKVIAEDGGDLELRDAQGATPLHIAAANGYSVVVEFLLDNHVSTDVVDNDLWQPIHAAACWGHPDVLEQLVQAGADLNARTKNGETPLEICEDPELKERIVQLRNEMETKKATHSLRLKRSHSQNTRSQSVRRTSIREKSQISRREAREEARLRQETSQNGEEEDSESNKGSNGFKSNDVKEETDSISTRVNGLSLPVRSAAAGVIDNIRTPPPPSYEDTLMGSSSAKSSLSSTNSSESYQVRPINKDAVVIRNEGYCERDSGGGNGGASGGDSSSSNTVVDGVTGNNAKTLSSMSEINVKESSSGTGSKSCLNNRGSSINSGGESVKVEIHVTVNASPSNYGTGTLADLKKHRADLRHRNSLSPVESPKNNAMDKKESSTSSPSVRSHTTNSHHHLTYLYEPPPSPSTNLKKFRADPSEVVGEMQNKGCCKLM